MIPPLCGNCLRIRTRTDGHELSLPCSLFVLHLMLLSSYSCTFIFCPRMRDNKSLDNTHVVADPQYNSYGSILPSCHCSWNDDPLTTTPTPIPASASNPSTALVSFSDYQGGLTEHDHPATSPSISSRGTYRSKGKEELSSLLRSARLISP